MFDDVLALNNRAVAFLQRDQYVKSIAYLYEALARLRKRFRHIRDKEKSSSGSAGVSLACHSFSQRPIKRRVCEQQMCLRLTKALITGLGQQQRLRSEPWQNEQRQNVQQGLQQQPEQRQLEQRHLEQRQHEQRQHEQRQHEQRQHEQRQHEQRQHEQRQHEQRQQLEQQQRQQEKRQKEREQEQEQEQEQRQQEQRQQEQRQQEQRRAEQEEEQQKEKQQEQQERKDDDDVDDDDDDDDDVGDEEKQQQPVEQQEEERQHQEQQEEQQQRQQQQQQRIAASLSSNSAQNLFSFYPKAIIMSPPLRTAEGTNGENGDNAEVDQKLSSHIHIVLLYNIALAHHKKYGESNSESDLKRAQFFYQRALSWMATARKEMDTDDLWLMMAISNNLGHIHSHRLNFSETRRFFVWLRHLIRVYEQCIQRYGNSDPDDSFFLTNRNFYEALPELSCAPTA